MQQMMMQMMNQMQQMQMQQDKKEINLKKPSKKDGVAKNRNYLRRERADEEVVVRSIGTENTSIIFNSRKTNSKYIWKGNGELEYLTVDQVLEMYSSNKALLTTPYLIVEDDEINEILGLSESSEVANKLDFETILDMTPLQIEKALEKCTAEFRKNFSSIVLEKIKNNELRDNFLIGELSRILKVDYSLHL